MEAFASGVIAVGTKVGLLADAGGESTTVEPGDAGGLADKIEKLVAQPRVIRDMQVKNRRFAEEHTAEWTCSEYKKLYEEMMQQHL